MKDRWINAGHEEDELKPFVEPELDISDQKRIGNYLCLYVYVYYTCFTPVCVAQTETKGG